VSIEHQDPSIFLFLFRRIKLKCAKGQVYLIFRFVSVLALVSVFLETQFELIGLRAFVCSASIESFDK